MASLAIQYEKMKLWQKSAQLVDFETYSPQVAGYVDSKRVKKNVSQIKEDVGLYY